MSLTIHNINSLNKINGLIFVMESGCVVCEVRSGFLYIIYIQTIFQRVNFDAHFLVQENSIHLPIAVSRNTAAICVVVADPCHLT